MTINITVADEQAFERELEQIYQWCVEADAPVRVSGAISVLEQGTLMYSCYKGGKDGPLNALRTSYPIGKKLWKYCDKVNNRLVDNGVVVDSYYVLDYTHKISFSYGTWANGEKAGLPVCHDYRAKMDDTDAMLFAIKHGGRLSKRGSDSR